MRTNDTDQKPCQVTCPYSRYSAQIGKAPRKVHECGFPLPVDNGVDGGHI